MPVHYNKNSYYDKMVGQYDEGYTTSHNFMEKFCNSAGVFSQYWENPIIINGLLVEGADMLTKISLCAVGREIFHKIPGVFFQIGLSWEELSTLISRNETIISPKCVNFTIPTLSPGQALSIEVEGNIGSVYVFGIKLRR